MVAVDQSHLIMCEARTGYTHRLRNMDAGKTLAHWPCTWWVCLTGCVNPKVLNVDVNMLHQWKTNTAFMAVQDLWVCPHGCISTGLNLNTIFNKYSVLHESIKMKNPRRL